MPLTYSGMPSELAAGYRGGAPDANGMVPERHLWEEGGERCRDWVGTVAGGEE